MGSDLYAVTVTSLGDSSDLVSGQRLQLGDAILKARRVKGRTKIPPAERLEAAIASIRELEPAAGIRWLFDLAVDAFPPVVREWPAPTPCTSFKEWHEHFGPARKIGLNQKRRAQQRKRVATDLDEALATHDPYAVLRPLYEPTFHRSFWLAQNAAFAAFPADIGPASAADVCLAVESIHSDAPMPAPGTTPAWLARFALRMIRDYDYFESPIWARYGEIMNLPAGPGEELIFGVELTERTKKRGRMRVILDRRWIGAMKQGDEFLSRSYAG